MTEKIGGILWPYNGVMRSGLLKSPSYNDIKYIGRFFLQCIPLSWIFVHDIRSPRGSDTSTTVNCGLLQQAPTLMWTGIVSRQATGTDLVRDWGFWIQKSVFHECLTYGLVTRIFPNVKYYNILAASVTHCSTDSLFNRQNLNKKLQY